jgi:hypothetical protein
MERTTLSGGPLARMKPLRIGRSGRLARPARLVLDWCLDADLDEPVACAVFLAARAFGWNARKTAEEFGTAHGTIRRLLSRGKAIVHAAILANRLRGDDLRGLAEMIGAADRF